MAVFCDWVSCSQEFPYDIPELTDGIVSATNNDFSKLDWQTKKGFQHEGSFDTRILVKSCDRRLSLSGNIGRLGRADNLFNHSLDDTKKLMNRLLDSLGLPNFTEGVIDYVPAVRKNGDGYISETYTGAKFSRIDITENFATGSEQNSVLFKHWLESQKVNRKSIRVHDNTVYWGKHSRYSTLKAYIKAESIKAELKRLNRKKNTVSIHKKRVREVQQYASENGIIRIENEFYQRFLSEKRLHYWHNATTEKLNEVFMAEKNKITKRVEKTIEIEDLPLSVKGTYYAYINGEYMGEKKATFYRHRKILLGLGIDIAETCNVQTLRIKPIVIELRPLEMPDWYELNRVS